MRHREGALVQEMVLGNSSRSSEEAEETFWRSRIIHLAPLKRTEFVPAN